MLADLLSLMEATVVIRTQIQLTEQQAQPLQALAKRRGVSMAELIRQGVDHLFGCSSKP